MLVGDLCEGGAGAGGAGGASGQAGDAAAGSAGTGGTSGTGGTGVDGGDGGSVASGTSCKQILDGGLSGGSGVYSIDPDGAGVGVAFPIYCDMLTDGGGWGLVTVSRTDDPDTTPFIGGAYCTALDTTVACKGHMPIAHVSSLNELLFYGLDSNQRAVVSGFTASAQSKIRFITGELAISTTSTWTRNGDTATDPNSMVVRTSGYPVLAAYPLRHYIRNGGWWMGDGPLAGFVPGGRLIAINYGGTQDLSELPVAGGYANPFPTENMALFYR